MALTDECLIKEKPHNLAGRSGVQRIYALPNGYGLSLVNNPVLHSYEFAWEAAVLRDVEAETGVFAALDYSTPLTSDVEVFDTEEEANAFIAKAIAWASAA